MSLGSKIKSAADKVSGATRRTLRQVESGVRDKISWKTTVYTKSAPMQPKKKRSPIEDRMRKAVMTSKNLGVGNGY
jgi:hypothetical protein